MVWFCVVAGYVGLQSRSGSLSEDMCRVGGWKLGGSGGNVAVDVVESESHPSVAGVEAGSSWVSCVPGGSCWYVSYVGFLVLVMAIAMRFHVWITAGFLWLAFRYCRMSACSASRSSGVWGFMCQWLVAISIHPLQS